jgi:pimeloyl-ACP methyl ester carboxylesterase
VATLIPLAEKLARKMLNRRGYASRSIPTKAGTLHAYDARGKGTLPPVVLVHGLGSSGTPFARVMERMRPYVKRIVALELPGHGFSELADVTLTPDLLFEAANEALDTFEGDSFVLVGNSMGGAVALKYAIDRPKRVRALCLMSPAGGQGTQGELDDVLGAFRAKGPREARELLRRIYHKQPWYLPLVALEFPSLLKRKPIRDILATATTEHAIDAQDLRALAMPILLVWGRSERLLPKSYFDFFRQNLPSHARVLEPDAVGHCPHFDDPAQVAELVLDLAREVP